MMNTAQEFEFPTNAQGKILKVSLDILSSSGLGGITFAEIARRSKMSKPNVAYYYESPNEILLELMKMWAATGQKVTSEYLLAHIGDPPERLVARIAEALFEWAIQYPLFSALSPVLIQAATSNKKVAELQRAVMGAGLQRIRGLLAQSPNLSHLAENDLDQLSQSIHCTMVGSYLYSGAQRLDLKKMKIRTSQMISHLLKTQQMAQ